MTLLMSCCWATRGFQVFRSKSTKRFAYFQRPALSSSATNLVTGTPQRIVIVGGGLAGLSTAFHLIEQRQEQKITSPLDITIVDKCPVGTGGASAVAGGLVHPLSPRGKLVHWGREGLEATNHLVKQASKAYSDKSSVILRSEIFRVATSQKQADQLQQTAKDVPDVCQWMGPAELAHRLSMPISEQHSFGGLRLHNGCQVLHLPSYLKGLWEACRKWMESDPTVSVQWKLQDSFSMEIDGDGCDAVVWAAGSGLFEQGENHSKAHFDTSFLPVQLVRGQSVEIRVNHANEQQQPQEGLLSGKYVSPLPEPNRVLVGATHEYSSEPMSEGQVRQELQDRTKLFCPRVWDERTAVIERYTTGTRVQSQRGVHGRLPIIGELTGNPPTTIRPLNDAGAKSWIFTGLSSRGLLYHGVYGKLLAKAILAGPEDCLARDCLDFDWWRRGK